MRVSLCIVARNEARWLKACIESARPVVDEVVVVDTGSSDATRALAREAGAHVVAAPWPGDLGAAHDLPLRFASGDWVLSLDGDEVLDPASMAELRRVIETGERRVDGFHVTIRNYFYGLTEKFRRADPNDPLTCGALGYRPTTPVRLFRRRPAYRFHGRLHQSMAIGIRLEGGRSADSPLVIHHYGGLRGARSKGGFYRALTRRQVNSEPASAKAWIELGATLDGRHDLPGALAAFRQARRFGQRATTAYLIGSTLVDLGRPELATSHLYEAIARNGRDRSPYFDRADAFECLAAAYEALAQPRRAAAAYREALELRPDSPAALNNLADLLTERGATRQAAATIEQLLRRFPGLSAGWATLGTLHLRQGDISAAQRAYERALSIDHHNLAARINVGIVHATRGQKRRSARTLRAVQQIGDGEAARQLVVATGLPPARRSPLLAMDPGGIVSVIADLHGGAGRVLVDAVRALKGRPQLVLCGNAESFIGQSLRSELRALGADVRAISSPDAVRFIVSRVAPACVLEHWSDNDLMSVPGERLEGVPWIAFGHRAFPMPEGYAAYVLLSEHQRQVQAHLPSHRLHRFSNGVDLQRFPRRPRSGLQTYIAMVSRLQPSKFVRRLADYLPPLGELRPRVLIAGTGGRRFEIEPELVERGLTGVRFVGPVSFRAMPGFLANAAIGLHLTEVDEEVCPIAVLEMLAAGLPIVAEPKGAIPEMVVHGVNGLLGITPQEIAEHLRHLIDDPALRWRMGAASRRMAHRYRMERFDASVRALVAAVCGGVGLPRRVTRRARPRTLERWRPRRSVVICGTPRAGSALLCEALSNTGLAGRAAHPSSYWFEVPGVEGRTSAAHLEQLAMAIEERCSPNGVFAAAFSLERWQHLMRALSTVDDREHTDGLAEALTMPSFIWVRRRDTLRQAISWVRAKQTGLWRLTPDLSGLAMPRPRFDAAAIQARLSEIGAYEEKWRDLFASLRQTPAVVWYEELARDYEGTAMRILSSLKIAVPRQLVFGERRLMRQADEVTDIWARRMARHTITPSA